MTDQPRTLRELARQAAELYVRTVAERADALVDHAPPEVLAGLSLEIDPPPVNWRHPSGDEWTVETDPEDRPIAARRSRWLSGGRLEVVTFVHGVEGNRTVLDMLSPPGSEEG
jgi:hypothetical protein